MTAATRYRRRVGSVRPSHLMFTAGVGALIDLPNFTALVRGIDDWSYGGVPDWQPIHEARLLDAVRRRLGAPGVSQLRPPPWMEGLDNDPNGPASRIGVPVLPFPQWFRCTRCNILAPLASTTFSFENVKPRRPDEARFFHPHCGKRARLAVPGRFLLACTNGHLDEFPFDFFVHRGQPCPAVSHPTLTMEDRGGNLGANVRIECTNCKAFRNISEALGARGEATLPLCRGRHPHLATFEDCDQHPKLLIAGASNQWFADTLSALAVPETGATALQTEVNSRWEQVKDITSREVLGFALTQPAFAPLTRWAADEVWAAIEQRRHGEPRQEVVDLLGPEWEIFTAKPVPPPAEDFALREPGVANGLRELVADVLEVERLREVRALIGFTRLDAPDPEDPDLVQRAPLSRDGKPTWVPASEVRGEGLFLRINDDLLDAWEARVESSDALEAHRAAYGRYRQNRYSGRISGPFDPLRGWPGARYYALHSLSHLLIRAIALECGYSSASLAERIYAGTGEHARSGILIYTAVPDAEGTLGGLVSLGEPDTLEHLLLQALTDATNCSSDPLCAERLPHGTDDFLHGAACHICLLVSETTCERGNRFLDRRFLVPVDDPKLALLSGCPALLERLEQ